MKPTNNEILNRTNIINAIPCSFEGRSLPQGTMSSLILLQVSYQRASDEFEKFVREAMEKAEPGYMEVVRASQIPEADDMTDERRAAKTEADEKMPRLNKTFNDLRSKHAEAEADKDPGKLTAAQFADICGMIGADGTIKLPLVFGIDAEGNQITEWPRAAFLQFLASTVVA